MAAKIEEDFTEALAEASFAAALNEYTESAAIIWAVKGMAERSADRLFHL